MFVWELVFEHFLWGWYNTEFVVFLGILGWWFAGFVICAYALCLRKICVCGFGRVLTVVLIFWISGLGDLQFSWVYWSFVFG